MPSPGYIEGQVVTQEALSQDNGTITVGTVLAVKPSYATLGGSYSYSTVAVVGAILRSHKLSVIDSVSVDQISLGTLVSAAKIYGYGLALGTLTGTIGTIGPATNNIVVQLYDSPAGTMVPVASDTVILGSINVVEVGK